MKEEVRVRDDSVFSLILAGSCGDYSIFYLGLKEMSSKRQNAIKNILSIQDFITLQCHWEMRGSQVKNVHVIQNQALASLAHPLQRHEKGRAGNDSEPT